MANNNETTFLKWWLIKHDNLQDITFFFESRINSNNRRFYPLYEKYQDVRVITLRGLKVKYLDLISLKLFRFLIFLSKRKIQCYKTLHSFNLRDKFNVSKVVLHIDDPEYTTQEHELLRKWENFYSNIGSNMILICTNNLSKNYYQGILKKTKIFIIEQGFHQITSSKKVRTSNKFICAYSSSYIHYGQDKHAQHSTWGAEVLIDEIIPKVTQAEQEVEFLIVGSVGKHAREALRNYTNVHLPGHVDAETNVKLLEKCQIGIYTRKFDHNRSVLKIFSYIGAGLPVVTFDLNDTEIVKKQKIGFAVKNSNEFIEKILLLKNSPAILNLFAERVNRIRGEYSWAKLAEKLKEIVDSN